MADSHPPSASITATPEEKFELLFEMLKRYYEALFEGTLRAAALLLVLGGWIASSRTLQWQLCRNGDFRVTAIALSVLGFVLYLIVAARVFHLSGQTAELLERLAYMEQEYYANYRLRWYTVLVWVAAFGGILAVLDVLVLAVAEPPCQQPT